MNILINLSNNHFYFLVNVILLFEINVRKNFFHLQGIFILFYKVGSSS